jgi:hypothetical protein
VIYIPHGISCQWEVGGAGAQGWLDVGACIYLYVDKMHRQMLAEAKTTADKTTTETPAEVKPVTPAGEGEKKPADDFGGGEH